MLMLVLEAARRLEASRRCGCVANQRPRVLRPHPRIDRRHPQLHVPANVSTKSSTTICLAAGIPNSSPEPGRARLSLATPQTNSPNRDPKTPAARALGTRQSQAARWNYRVKHCKNGEISIECRVSRLDSGWLSALSAGSTFVRFCILAGLSSLSASSGLGFYFCYNWALLSCLSTVDSGLGLGLRFSMLGS